MISPATLAFLGAIIVLAAGCVGFKVYPHGQNDAKERRNLRIALILSAIGLGLLYGPLIPHL